MSRDEDVEVLSIAGREVRITHPGKLYFSGHASQSDSEAQSSSQAGHATLTKLDLVRYYLAVAPGAVAGVFDRPFVLKRFVNGAAGEPFYQKRAPTERPAWLRTATLSFPSGRTAEEVVIDDPAGLAWVVNLGCIELHPHPVRTTDLDHPDELRIDLDPGPGVSWADVRLVALEVQSVLAEAGLEGWPKTSGSRGIHVNVRIHPRWGFTEVRRAALALARAVERRAPSLASSKWWKEERHGVFLDYNQNAKDRTTCSAYSVRPLPDARVSAPLDWAEVPDVEPADFTVLTMPARFAERGDPHSAMDQAAGSLDALLELAARDEANGLGDAPWPPHFAKGENEAPRVAPSRARRPKAAAAAKEATEPGPSHPVSPTIDIAASSETGSAGAKLPNNPTQPNENPAIPANPARARSTRTGTKRSTMPLLTIAHSPDKAAALAGLERWKLRHPEAAALLAIDDVLVDRMRGRSSLWTRIRVNLRHVPEALRPPQEPPDPDDDPTRA